MIARLGSLALLGALLFCIPSWSDAGAVKGPKRWVEKVDANSKVAYQIEFKANVMAEFAIIGDGDTDVDVYVFDDAGREVTRDIGLSDLGMVRWEPTRQQVYRIEVRNLGSVWNKVTMGHN